ncbi:hypothetical protein H6F43_12540 [Leptolyngbya sp. FACHB-36]|uniref:hypothetical protein n=1 Tax=Leptolyngbya sp. FACHB-36 TaxID=2692808 RepID=UPI0016814C20|nr:hypothetical protein [Leptolyngbya sp. FACHB-36]MBD2021008.1 hypothetical protein [Leptolyngbya sp. FACHB-36]
MADAGVHLRFSGLIGRWNLENCSETALIPNLSPAGEGKDFYSLTAEASAWMIRMIWQYLNCI